MREIVLLLVERYTTVADNLDYLQKTRISRMLTVLRDESQDWPVDKTNRWIGFVQGVLWSHDLLNIDEEREFTRPLFHAYYRSISQDIPETVNVSEAVDD